LIKNSQPFGKNFQKTLGGIFFDSHCIRRRRRKKRKRCLYDSKTTV